jgi:hypothetical protein
VQLFKAISVVIATFALCSCGGATDDPFTFDAAVALAEQSRSSAKSFALANLACVADSDCTSMGLLDERSACLTAEYVPLSLLSPTFTQARRAAADQNGFAVQAFTLSGRPPPPCLPPTPGIDKTVCTQQQCRLINPFAGLPQPLRP